MTATHFYISFTTSSHLDYESVIHVCSNKQYFSKNMIFKFGWVLGGMGDTFPRTSQTCSIRLRSGNRLFYIFSVLLQLRIPLHFHDVVATRTAERSHIDFRNLFLTLAFRRCEPFTSSNRTACLMRRLRH